MSGITLADGVEFQIGMSLFRASNNGLREEKTSPSTHCIKDGKLYRRKFGEDDVYIPGGWLSYQNFSTANAALDNVIAGYDKQIERLKQLRDRLEAMKR